MYKDGITAAKEVKRVSRALSDILQHPTNVNKVPVCPGVYEVQVMRDGELVVLHDLQRVLDASRYAAVNEGVVAPLAEEADDPGRADVQVSYRGS